MEETIGEMLQRLSPEEKEAVRAAPSIPAPTAEQPTNAANSNLSWRFAQALAGGMGPGPAGWGHAYQAGWRPTRDDPATRFILGFTPPGAAMDLYEDGRDAKQAFEEGRSGAAAWHTSNAALDAAGLIPGLALATKAVRGVGKLARTAEEIANAHSLAQRNAVKMLGLPPDNTPLQRAAAMGFKVNEPVFHGTDRTFAAFDPRKRGDMTGTRSGQAGYWVTPEGEHADDFAKLAVEANAKRGRTRGSAHQVLPLLYRSDAQFALPPKALAGPNYLAHDVMNAWDDGFDSVRTPRTGRVAKPDEKQVVVRDPAQLRSRFAAFDPAKRHSPDLLASYIAAALMGTGAVGATGVPAPMPD